MLIGMTYDLQDDYLAQGFSAEEAGEFDALETIDAIENGLRATGYAVERIGNIKALVNALAKGKRWDMVFNIAEGIKGIAREAQVPALLEAYNIPCIFSSADVLVATHDKALAKRIVHSAGIPTADYFVVRNEEDIDRIDMAFPLFAKPLAEGTSKGIHASSYISTTEELRAICLGLLQQYSQPVLVESFLPGREFTVCMLGTGKDSRVGAIGEIKIKPGGDEKAYTYRNKVDCFDDIVLYKGPLAKAIGKVALESWNALGCCDCGRIDIRMSETGVPHFLEVNLLPGLRPDYSELPILLDQAGIAYNNLIGSIVSSAMERYKMNYKYEAKRRYA